MTRATSRRTPLAAATITHLHRTPRFAPLLTPPPHNERSIHSRDDNDNDIDALVHVVAVKISQQHLTQPRRYVSLRLFWDDMDNCGKCLDYSYGGPRPDRELFRPWRKKSPAAIEAEQQLKEDKHPTKKHARTQKVTRPLTQTKQLLERLPDSRVDRANPPMQYLRSLQSAKRNFNHTTITND
ncbi:hypothetical protein BU15DRAFT_79602 [Melanogaster broomeanus]|nr:hypothetical protein BU15DRAFT_79602 [Melanogaster broomeanus]